MILCACVQNSGLYSDDQEMALEERGQLWLQGSCNSFWNVGFLFSFLLLYFAPRLIRTTARWCDYFNCVTAIKPLKQF